MATESIGYLSRQFETAWELAYFHLEGLSTAEWRAVLDHLTDDDLKSTQRTRWPFRERPFGDVVTWVNVELTKNASEIGYARFLYASRIIT